MRKLFWFTLGFGTAAAVCAWLLWDNPMVFVGAAGAVPALLLLGKSRFRPAGAVLLGFSLGLGWFSLFQTLYLNAAAALDHQQVKATVIASDYGVSTARGTAADGILKLDGRPYQVRLYLKGEPGIEPGDRITGTFRFRVTTAQGDREPTFHPGKGIFLLGYSGKDTVTVPGDRQARWLFPARLRQNIRRTIEESFPADTSAFAKALLLGDTSGLTYARDVDMQISGIRHMVAVSGLHVAILFGMLQFLTLRRSWLTALAGAGVFTLFAAVAGFTPSVTRACIMMELMLIARALRREYDPLTELAFSCLVMLLINPLVITSVSFQLSAASVLGILLFGSRIRDYFVGRFPVPKKRKRLRRFAADFWAGVAVSISALTFVTPLCAWIFGTVSLVSVLTNLLTVWAVSYIFYGILLTCVLSPFWAWGAGAAAAAASWLIRYVQGTAAILAEFPLAAVYTESPYIVFWLISLYVLLGIFLLQKKKQPLVITCCGVCGLCLALVLSWAEPLTDQVRMTVLDVGQGQCILLQSGGRTMLVDCGGEYDEEAGALAARTLLSQGVGRADVMVLTHYDRDHIGGTPYFLARMKADRILLPVPGEDDAVDFGTETSITYVEDRAEFQLGHGKITVFGGVPGESSNENCLCVLFEGENCDILITGDRSEYGEKILLEQTNLPKVHYLLAGHHGAKTSTCQALLEQVQPDTVIISAGKDNPYGHPAPETLERLNQFGCRILRTDRDGTILIRR